MDNLTVPASQPTFNSADDVINHVDAMRKFFLTGQTLNVATRKAALRLLKDQLKAHEDDVLAALHEDLGKAPFEAYATELGLVYDEIDLYLKKLNSWARPRCAKTPIVHFPSVSFEYPSPHGVVAVLSPWNYPVQLALVPLVDAIGAGNCVGLKPSRTSKATGQVLLDLISEVFPPEYVCVFPGSGDMNNWLLKPHFDFVCFTGSPGVGVEIMTAAAGHHTPVLLELGGKSPCIIDSSANLKRAGERIAWGKGINCGQTCVAPDYFLVHESAVEPFVAELKASFHRYYGADILTSPDWPHMISEKHFKRVLGLIENHNPNARVAFGGRSDPETLRIEPTCLVGVTMDDPIMGEEIFGPAMPVLTYTTLDEAFAMIRTLPEPLATYVFAEDPAVQRRVVSELSFGGGCINDVVIHESNNHLGFGGKGNSGMGRYHGKYGFDTFTHYKGIMKKSTLIELPIRVPPFTDFQMQLVRFFMH